MKLENRFRLQVGLVMLCLLGGFVWFVQAFGLDYQFALSKLPLLAGLELSPEGFIQGIPLTLLLCLLSTVLAVAIGMLSALGRLSSNPLLYGLATFYNSFFKGSFCGIEAIIKHLFFLLHFCFSSSTHANNSHSTTQFCPSFFELFFVIRALALRNFSL